MTTPERLPPRLSAAAGLVALLVVSWAFFAVGVRFGVFVSLYWIVGLVFYYWYARLSSDPLDPLSPGFVLVMVLFLYAAAPGLYVERRGHTYLGDVIPPSVLNQYYVACLLGLLGLAIGVSGARRHRRAAEAPRTIWLLAPSDACVQRVLSYVAVFLAIVSFPFIVSGFDFFQVPSYSERAMELRLEWRDNVQSGVLAVVSRDVPTALILAAACLLVIRSRSLWVRGMCLLLFAAYIATNTLAGWRGIVISALLMPVVFYHYRVRPLRLWSVAILALLGYLITSGLALVRQTSDARQMMQVMSDEVRTEGMNFAKLDSSGELMVGGNLMTLIQGINDGSVELTYGKSLVTEFATFIPRSLYPDRPLTLGEQFAREFSPTTHDAGGGFGFFCVMEGYWAFGYVGTFVFMLVFGWSVERVYQWFMRNMTRDVTALWYHGVFVMLVLVSVRNGIIGTYKLALMNSLPFLVLALASRIWAGRESVRGPDNRVEGEHRAN